MTAKVRPVLSNLGRVKGSTANNYISSCSRCHRGIFRDQPYEWGTGQYLGLVHTECAEGEMA